MPIKRFIYLFGLLVFLVSCSTTKNTVVSRAYHNLTARYNGYYYSCVNIDDGIYKLEKANKDNFDKILPVYIYPPSDKVKATVAEFDKAIKKSSLCIQKHAIKDKKGEVIPSSGNWIDNNWINIGIAHIYKREFFSGLESFEYVAKTYKASKDKYTALLWMIKANNEIGSVSSSEPIISLLKNEKKLPAKIKNQLPAAQADYFMRRGMNTEAATKLMEAARNSNIFTGIAKSKRARYTFIIAQLFEAQKENKRALEFYKKTISLKPNYEMVFYAKIKMARLLDVKRNSSEKTKKDLLKMSKEFKNSDYYDVIFYTLGEIEEKERSIDKAVYYYKRSVQTSTANPTQKALSFLKLGEINFDLANYQPSGAYYDSAIVTLPKDHRDYNNIVARKKTLETLIGYIKTIKNEDSLQRLANMSDADRNSFIDKLIAKKEREEELKQKQKEAALTPNIPGNLPGTPGTNPGPLPGDGTAASFYFYSPSAVALGVAEFTKKWGNRKYEENWRRSNKALIADNITNTNDNNETATNTKEKDPVKLRAAYKKNLPVNDSLIKVSNEKIVDSYYLMGSLYKEELNNTKKAVASFEELNNRFPKNKYLLNTYYVLYRIYLGEKKQDKSDYYKEKILNEFPDSEFALLIKNPNSAVELNAKKSEVETFYLSVYQAYQNSDYSQSYSLSSEGVTKFGKNDYLPKFEFIKALSYGKIKGIDSMEYSLKLLTANYPKSEVTPLANDILLSIKKQKNPEMFKPSQPGLAPADTFAVNFDGEHFFIAIVPDDPKIANAFKSNLDAFNTKFFPSKSFSLNSNLFGANKQLVILKSFASAQEIMSYMDSFLADKDVFKDEVKRDMVEVMPILAGNLPFLYKKKNVEGYKLFYLDNYKKFNPKQ
jgi:tetratricopeptide (TPR) repeat protein